MYIFLASLTIMFLYGLRLRIEEKLPIMQNLLEFSTFAMITLKLGSAIDWDWLFVLSPLLALWMLRYLAGAAILAVAIAIKLSGSEEKGNQFCDRLQKKLVERHERKIRLLDEIRKQFAHN